MFTVIMEASYGLISEAHQRMDNIVGNDMQTQVDMLTH